MELLDIMSLTAHTFNRSDNLLNVVNDLAERHLSCALVCDDDKPVGIITERDIVRLVAKYSASGLPLDITLQEVMTPNPVTLSLDANIADALSFSQANHIRHLPIVDESGSLLGIVTQTDLAKSCFVLSEKNEKLEKLNHDLHWLSLEDSLTGLPNRRSMDVDLRHNEAISRRQSQSYAIALIDIDYFKRYNDHYGHPAGDKALQQVSDTMKSKVRDSDRLYRYGGEEFLYLMPNTDSKGALIGCERIRDAVLEQKMEHCKSQIGFLTISIGISAGIAQPWEELIKQADEALYDSKAQGRNTVSCYLKKEP